MAETASRFQVPGKHLNLADAFLDRNLREGRESRAALIIDDPDAGVRTVSYGELAAEANRYGRLLSARGVSMEHRVLIILEDGLPWAASFFGAQKLGAVTAFVNPAVSDEELAFYIEDSRARAVVTTAAIANRLTLTVQPKHGQTGPAVISVDAPQVRMELDAYPQELDAAPTLEDDFAIWLFTSGSTGAPKAAVHRARDFIYNTERYAKDILQMTEADITVSVPKLFFGYATGSNLMFPLFFGGAAILFPDRPTPERLFTLIQRHRATVLIGVPTMIAKMCTYQTEAETAPDCASLRVCTSAGEALPPELYHRWKEATGVEILDGIGSAEMFHVFISARLGEVIPGSLGTLVPGYEAKIVGPEGNEVEAGEVGTLHVGGGSSAAFYWNRQDQSRAVLQGYWVVTSDLFKRDDQGYYWYQGRSNDTLKVAGRWFQPQEVEACLTEDEAVAEAGVAPFQQDGLPKPMAFVVLAPGHTMSPSLEERLCRRVADRLAPFKAPRFITDVAGLPRGDRDKLDRPTLARLAGEAAAVRSS